MTSPTLSWRSPTNSIKESLALIVVNSKFLWNSSDLFFWWIPTCFTCTHDFMSKLCGTQFNTLKDYFILGYPNTPDHLLTRQGLERFFWFVYYPRVNAIFRRPFLPLIVTTWNLKNFKLHYAKRLQETNKWEIMSSLHLHRMHLLGPCMFLFSYFFQVNILLCKDNQRRKNSF